MVCLLCFIQAPPVFGTLGVVIVPEFDSPGHSAPAWRGGPPGLLAPCGIRPDLERNFRFLDALFGEALRSGCGVNHNRWGAPHFEYTAAVTQKCTYSNICTFC